MQAAVALMEPGAELEIMVPVEWLPDEVLELLFCFQLDRCADQNSFLRKQGGHGWTTKEAARTLLVT